MAEYKKKRPEDLDASEIGSAYDQQNFSTAEKHQVADIVNAARAGETGWDDAHAFVEGTRKKHGYSGGSDGSAYKDTGGYQIGAAPEYINKYQQQIEALSGNILNRPKFDYDPENDPTYKALEQVYTSKGQQAMKDTLGQVSARTGGLASSYATTAGQQAYNGFMDSLAAQIPELKELAYRMYMDEGNTMRNNLAILQGLEAGDYNRFQGQQNQWNADRGFGYGQHRDEISDNRYNTEWQHGLDREALEDQRYDQNWQHQLDREGIEDQRYDQSWQHQLDREGIEDNRWNQQFNYQKQQDALSRADRRAAAASKGSGGGGRGGSDKPRLTGAQAKQALEDGIINDSTKAAYEYYFGQPWDGGEGGMDTVKGGSPSFNYDEDEGIFQFNGKSYNSLDQLNEAINNTSMSDAQFEQLMRKLKIFGIPVSVE